MNKLLITLLILLLLSCTEIKKEISSSNSKNEPITSVNEKKQSYNLKGIYEYNYEHNSDDFIENHYIEFKADEVIYYGTSDDFDEGREGYLPGFFNSRVKNFKKEGDKISFSVIVTDSIFYQKPIRPINKIQNNDRWSNGLTSNTRQYDGSINGDTIVLRTKDFDPRVFIKIKK